MSRLNSTIARSYKKPKQTARALEQWKQLDLLRKQNITEDDTLRVQRGRS